MSSVIAAGPGLVAVGGDGSDSAVWTSADGIAWSRAPHDESAFGGAGGQGMTGVIAAGPGLVAVGSAWSTGELGAAVWISPDGIAWSRVADDER